MIKLKDNSTQEIDTALYQLEQSLTSKIKSNSNSQNTTGDSAALEKEISERKAADNSLKSAISSEATARENADNSLSSSISTKQDKLTAGDNITITGSTISAKDTTYSVESPVTLNNTTIGLTTVPISKGGTGATTAKAAECNVLSGMTEEDADPVDSSMFAGVYLSPSATIGKLYKRSALHLWNYIKSKISSVLGLTATSYGGNANTATTATKAKDLGNSYYSSGASTSYTISTFLEKLVSLGVIAKYAEYAKPFRFNWYYAGNGTLSTDYGTITLAGTQIIFLGVYCVDPTTSGENGNNFDIIFQCNPQTNAAGLAATLKYTCRSGSGYGPKWTLYNCSRRTVIPTSEPSTKVNGDIWIE